MSERASKGIIAAEHASKASSSKQAYERAVQSNEHADEQIVQYSARRFTSQFSHCECRPQKFEAANRFYQTRLNKEPKDGTSEIQKQAFDDIKRVYITVVGITSPGPQPLPGTRQTRRSSLWGMHKKIARPCLFVGL